MRRNQHAGRIRPDERDTDDAVTTFGASLPDSSRRGMMRRSKSVSRL
jgi:hypothetical protein